MKFFAEEPPFPEWIGPYSIVGKETGFRVRSGRLGVNLIDDVDRSWCLPQASVGIRQLESLVKQHFGGGRILFLPGGHVIKPKQERVAVSTRVVIGKYSGGFILNCPDFSFDLRNSSNLVPGTPWIGPRTLGLKCKFESNGKLLAEWSTRLDSEIYGHSIEMSIPNATLYKRFKKARNIPSGGVRITICGHTYTTWQTYGVNGKWQSIYLGQIDLSRAINWEQWVKR